MSRPNPYLLTGFLLVFVAVFGGFSVLQDGLYLDTHEADTYHHLDILFRMEQGQLPHRDFMTPLGILSFLPVVYLMQSGMAVGLAFLWAQFAIALALWPVTAYAAATRLPRRLAYVFGAFVLGLVLALTYGGAASGVSISMHYNRWAWALAFVILVLSVLPPRGRSFHLVDGAIIGALSVALLLLKITFFLCLVPIAALALIWRGAGAALVAAVIAGILTSLAATLAFGPAHWVGYLADLRAVAGSEVRPSAGVPLDQIVAGPAFLAGTVVAILSVLLLRNGGHPRTGLLLLLLLPAFVYITFQNFGNDPKWLVFLPVLLLTLRPEPGHYIMRGVDLSDAALWLSVAAITLIAPSLVNLTLSPLKHAGIQSGTFLPMIPAERGDPRILIRSDRANTLTAEVHLDESSPIWAKYAKDVGRPPALDLGGVEFTHCELYAGSRASFVEIAADFEASGLADGNQVFTADILSAFWLFGSADPLQEGAPWYYGNLSGIENADYVLVPKCPFLSALRRIVIDDLKRAGTDLVLMRDNDLYALFRVGSQ